MMESPLFLFDAGFRAANGVFCGIDEAGRGPLAGPVCAGCALLPEGLPLAGLNDSKKLTEKRREALFEQLTADETVCWGVGWASPAEIDDVNILQATFLAMGRAYADMQTRFPTIAPVLALVDGNRTPPLPLPVQTLIGGDGKSASVAAASIIAKVSRDRLMKKLAEQYPQYQLDKHKGYPTKLHYEMIEQYGISEIHRRSFLKGCSNLKWKKKTAGALGEDYTAQWLSEHGYTILERNWHSRRGEVDIIARKGEIVAFVEVKTRRDGAMVSPYIAVVYQKQRKLAVTAQAYCFTHRCELQPRFDVAAVTIADDKVIGFDYMEAAFDGSVVDDSF